MKAKDLDRRLKHFDSALRVRWSTPKGRWVVERKVSKGFFNMNRPCSYDSDRFRHITDGYIHVGDLTPQQEFQTQEVNLILKNLYDNDVWRFGGADKLSDILDEEYAREQARLDREISNENQELAGEAYEDIAWKEKRRVAVQ